MSQPSEFEARLEAVAEDAAAARHLAAARDRDLADYTTKIDANRKAINALGVQTAARFDEMERRFEQVDRRFEQVDRRFESLEAEMRTGFANVRHQLDQTTGGLARIIDLLERRPDSGS